MEKVIDDFLLIEQPNENEEKQFLNKLEPLLEKAPQQEQLDQIQRISNNTLIRNFQFFLKYSLEHLPKNVIQYYQQYLQKNQKAGFLSELKKQKQDSRMDSMGDWCFNYIFEKMINNQNYQEISQFLFDYFQQTKLGFEKNLLILEILYSVVLKSKYNLQFHKIIECIYQFLGICLMKYKQQKQDSNKKDYYYTAETFLTDYINKLLKKFQQDFKPHKEILKMEDIHDFNIQSLQKQNKALNPIITCKHYVTVFAMDLMDGVLEVQHNSQISIETSTKLLSIIQQVLESFNQNLMDYLNIYRHQIFMQKHEKVQIENKEYSYASVYNVSAIGYLFVNNFKNDKNIFNFIYDISYKLEIEQDKAHMKQSVFNTFYNYFKDTHYEQLINLNQFNTPIDKFLNLLLEYGFNNYYDNKLFIQITNIFQKFVLFYNLKNQYLIYVNIFKESSNRQVQEYILDNVVSFFDINKIWIQQENFITLQSLIILLERNMRKFVEDSKIIKKLKFAKLKLNLFDYIIKNTELFNQEIRDYFKSVLKVYIPEIKNQYQEELKKYDENVQIDAILKQIDEIHIE